MCAWLSGKESACSAGAAGDPGLIPGSGRSPGEGTDNPLQYSRLESPMEGGAWWATVHGVVKSQTRLSDFTSLLQVQRMWVKKDRKMTRLERIRYEQSSIAELKVFYFALEAKKIT